MNGWDLKYHELEIADTSYFSIIQSFIATNQFKTTSYKYCFFKAILDNIFSVDSDLTLSFECLNETFGEVYWNLIAVHNIPQKTKSKEGIRCSIQVAVEEVIKEYGHCRGVYYSVLNENIRKIYLKKTMAVMKKHVVGALSADLKFSIYGFDKKQHRIWFSKESLDFLKSYKVFLEQINFYEWLKYCEKCLNTENRNIPNLSLVLEEITKRSDLKVFRENLKTFENSDTCFYCGLPLSKTPHVDHVIPWSFIKKDYLWNFVLCCQKCNSKKSNSIPSKEILNRVQKRNEEYGIDSPNITDIGAIAIANGFAKLQ